MRACALTRQGRGRPDNRDRYLIKELEPAGLLVAVDTLAERIDPPDSRGLEDKVAALSAAALAAGTRDDLTVVLVRV